MHGRVKWIGVAVASIALGVIPAAASASPTLMVGSESVPVGASFRATNIGNVKFTTSLGTLECQQAMLMGTVTQNSGTAIEEKLETVSMTGSGAEGRCTTSFLGDLTFVAKRLPWCLKGGGKLPKDRFVITSGACPGGGTLEFDLDSTIWGSCSYPRPSLEGTFSTGTGPGSPTALTVSEQEFSKSAGGFLCPGSMKLDTQLKLETVGTESQPIWID